MAGLAGGAGTGATAFVVSRGVTGAIGAALGGAAAAGATIGGGVAYTASKEFGWYEINCSIKKNFEKITELTQTSEATYPLHQPQSETDSFNSSKTNIHLTKEEEISARCRITKQIMTEPVVVNGRDYEKSAILKLVQETGKDVKGEEVKIDDPRQFNPSTKKIQRLCKNARKREAMNIPGPSINSADFASSNSSDSTN